MAVRRFLSSIARTPARRIVVNSDKAPNVIGPYSHAVKYGDMLYLSGQMGLDPKTGELVNDDASAQARQALTNMSRVLEAGGSSLANVVKATVFFSDLNDYAAVNKVYKEFFPSEFPARTGCQVAALPKNAKVEIEAIAIAASNQP